MRGLLAAVAVLGIACLGDELERGTTGLATIGNLTVVEGFGPEPVTPDVASVYFTIHNRGDQDDRIVHVAVSVAQTAEIHSQVSGEGGMVRMEPVSSLVVTAGDTVALMPGAVHVMLHGLTSPYAAGDSLLVAVTLERAGVMEFWVPVIPYAEVAERSEGMSHEGHQ